MSAAISPRTTVQPARRLADAYADRHERLDEFIVMYALPRQLFARLGIELHTGRGYGLLCALFFLAIFIPTLAIAGLTSSWTESLPMLALAVSATLAVLNVLALILAQGAAFKISALHRVLMDESEVQALVRWDGRWYSPGMSALMGGSIALAFLVVLYQLDQRVTGIGLSATSLWFSAVIAIFLGQFTFSTAMIFVEFRKFTACRFALYALSPIDTHALQTTSAGLKQLGIVWRSQRSRSLPPPSSSRICNGPCDRGPREEDPRRASPTT